MGEIVHFWWWRWWCLCCGIRLTIVGNEFGHNRLLIQEDIYEVGEFQLK